MNRSGRVGGERNAARTAAGAPAEAPQSYIALLQLHRIRREIRPENWPAQRHRVLAVVQHVARGMIGETDSLALHGDEVCVIAFGETTYEAAALGAAAIARKIVKSLFGETGLERIQIESRVLPLKDLALHGDFFAAAAVQQAAPPSAPEAGPTAISAAMRPEPKGNRARRQQILGLFTEEPCASHYNIYLPIWSARSKMAERFLLVRCRDDIPPSAACGYALPGSGRSDKSLVAFDIAAIEEGLLSLKQAIDSDIRAELMLPLHFDTAGSNQGRAELQEIFPNLPSFVRSRLSFALYGVPSGIPHGRLHEVAGALKRLVKDVVIVLEPHAIARPALRSFMGLVRSAGIPGVAVSLPPERTDDTLDAACAIGARAAAHDLAVSAFGVTSSRQAHRLSVAGFTRFGGILFGGPFHELPAAYAVHAKVFEGNG